MTMPLPTRRSIELRSALTPWTDAMLDAKRTIGDEYADEVIAQVFAGGSAAAVNSLWAGLVHNTGIVSDDLPAPVREYLNSTNALPAWADGAKLHRAGEIFALYGAQICMALLCGALPISYAAAKGVQVLGATERMRTGAKRRIIETTQFLFDVMQPYAFTPTGEGIRSAQKVRLIHAAIRYHITEEHEAGRLAWEREWGVPLNQEDLAGFLMTLSCETVGFLRKLDIELSAADAEAYLHAWKVAGYLLGVEGDLLPLNMDDACALSGTIQERQRCGSPVGKEMTRALIELLEELSPGKVYDGVPAAMIRYLVGDETANLLGLEPKHGHQLLFRATLKVLDLLDDLADHRATSELAERFGRILLHQAPLAPRANGRPAFELPLTLKEQWHISNPKPNQWKPDKPHKIAAEALKRETDDLPSRPWLTRQQWHHLCFAHWPLAPEVLQPLLPKGLELDTFGGMGWLSLVAMELRNAHFRGLPPFPKLPGILARYNLSDFPELNLRTYVRRNGRIGVYFFSLDTSSELIVALAEHLFKLPYFAGGMELKEERGVISFCSRRDDDPGAPGVYECKFRPVGGPLPLLPDTLDHFLAERDLMWTKDDDDDLFVGQIHHPPWVIYDAEAVIERNTMPQTIGLTIAEPPALLRYAEHTETVLWMIEPDRDPEPEQAPVMAAGD